MASFSSVARPFHQYQESSKFRKNAEIAMNDPWDIMTFYNNSCYGFLIQGHKVCILKLCHTNIRISTVLDTSDYHYICWRSWGFLCLVIFTYPVKCWLLLFDSKRTVVILFGIYHLAGSKPLSEPVLEYSNWNLGNKLQWNLHLSFINFR